MAKTRKKLNFKPHDNPKPDGKIVAHSAPTSGSTNDVCPIFSLEHVEGDYCLSKCTTEEKASFADTLHKLGRQTWGVLKVRGRHKGGFEKIARHALGDRKYPPEVTDEVNMVAFRFCAMKPMVGYRVGRVFVILFLDRDFTLYDHGG